MRMLPVLLEVLLVGRHQLGLALDYQQVFRIVLLGRLREVEAPGDNRRLVDQDDLVVGDSVFVVDEDRDARVGDERGRGVLLRFLALVQDDPILMGSQKPPSRGVPDWPERGTPRGQHRPCPAARLRHRHPLGLCGLGPARNPTHPARRRPSGPGGTCSPSSRQRQDTELLPASWGARTYGQPRRSHTDVKGGAKPWRGAEQNRGAHA